MSLEILKQEFLNNEINLMQLGHKLKHYQIQLDQLFPQQGPLAAKFWAFVYQDTSVICETSGKFKTFDGWTTGFRKFCGNQSICDCNKKNAANARKNKTVQEKQTTIQKRKFTNRQKYGADFASQTEDTKKKSLATCMRKYGAKAPTCNPIILEKSSSTCLNNNGTLWPQQNAEIFEKTQSIFQEKYGVSRPAQHPDIKEQLKNQRREQGFDLIVKNYPEVVPLFDKQTYISADFSTQLSWKCVNCSHIWLQTKKPHEIPRCLVCYPPKETWGETLIKKWLMENNQTFVQWDRTQIAPMELDFWLPNKNLGIEFNGTWHHREEAVSSRNYHQLKFKSCESVGIRLIQIWEHELLYKQDIVLDRLNHAIGNNTQKIAARKCTIEILDHATSREFFNKFHLQGHQTSKHMFGLFHNNILVGAASFVPVRYNKHAEWELLRYASATRIQIQGGLSKLLNHAHKVLGIRSLVTYANLNWGMGLGYQKTGFEFQYLSKPNYWYFRGLKEIHSRIKFQKHKILGLAPGNTEKEIALNMGYLRFFDAGNSVWIKHW